jgi:metal-responsive CopG/Arc/MetJ family transcriptional regulator
LGTVQVNVRVEDEVYRLLNELRKRKGKLSVPEIIREAISEYLEKQNTDSNGFYRASKLYGKEKKEG